MRRSVLVPLTSLLVLSACVSPKPAEVPAPPPPPPAAPEPVAPPPAPPVDWRDRALTPGDWRYRSEGNGSVAFYGQLNRAADLSIRCDRSTRRIAVARPGVLDPGRSAKITLRGTEGVTSYPVVNFGGSPPQVGVSLSAADQALDRLVFSRGRILVQIEGAPDIVVPTWAEIARVVEDCRG